MSDGVETPEAVLAFWLDEVGEDGWYKAEDALDRAVRKALLPYYPELVDVQLVDYKVRIVDEHLGTGARPRVIVESARGTERWSTVGCSENIIEASWEALVDSLEYAFQPRQPAGGGRRAAEVVADPG